MSASTAATTAAVTTDPMPDFRPFAKAVHARYAELAKGELYLTDPGDLFATYLAAFPPGTNPVYRKAPHYDCNTCKNFVRRVGKAVAIKGAKVLTVWEGLDLPHPFSVVAAAMDAAVRAAPVVSVFRSKEAQYGAESNFCVEGDKAGERFDHFWGEVGPKHRAASPGEEIGKKAAARQVLRRGLLELREVDLGAVLELIDANGLYKGAEFRPMVAGFLELMQAFKTAPDGELFVWEHVAAPHAQFRNTAIGNLFVELAEGKPLEAAVKSYEKTVAPANYKRPTAVITKSMVDDALETINKLDLGGAIARRHAKFSDVSVADVLFVDNAVRGKLKGGIADILAGAVKTTPPKLENAVTMRAETFVAEVLPKAKSLAVYVENRHAPNFVSLTGGDGPERMFKWDNNFAWAYAGDVADSELRRQVQALGGRVDGVLRFSHTWNYDKRNASLMDLHVFLPGSSPHEDGCHDRYPSGQRVGWNKRTDPTSGGNQDVDYTQPAPAGYVPVENITFPSMAKLKDGPYTFKIHNWQLREPTKAGVRAEIEFGGQVFPYEIERPLKHKEWVTVAVATLKNGAFTIEHKLQTTTTSREVWGVKTESLVPVEMVCYSPNHWGDNKAGAKHLIFALEGCKNPEPCRGFFNEQLRADLDQHRKVFEVLASRTKCPYADEQISGVGFTAARGHSVVVVVDGKRSYKLEF